MPDDLKLLVVIPARGGSKRVPNKNIRLLAGRPLLSYTLEAIRAAKVAATVVVSTDAEDIAKVAQEYGAAVVRRPSEFAQDSSSTESVLLDAIEQLDPKGQKFQWIMTLPPTSPFRKPETICRFVAEVAKNPGSQEAFMSVTEDRRDFWQPGDHGCLNRLFPEAPRRQQDRQPLLEENGLVYLTPIAVLKSTGFILGRKVRGIVTDPRESFDINSLGDFEVAEAMMKAQGN